jgi:hypothetical protein
VLLELAGEFSDSARAAAEGEGDERVVDFARRIMDATAHFQPIRAFVERETQLALRLLIGERGAVHGRLVGDLLKVIAETRSLEQAEALEQQVDGIIRMAAALQWATLAIGDEPQTELAADIIRALLRRGCAA